MIRYEINPKYSSLKDEILQIPGRFETEGEVIHALRNVIKVITVGGIRMNVKSFKVPHLINRFAYAYVRKSKAERSFEYGNKLLALGVNNPEPVAYIVYRTFPGITRSYYISLQQEYDFTFEGLIKQQPENMEPILRAFTRFTYNFHTQGVYFVDHSPANTLIRRMPDGQYSFSLVDLNRIKFMKISPYAGLQNFYRLHMTDAMIRIVADEYATLCGADKEAMTLKLTEWIHAHDEQVRKKRIAKGLSPDYLSD